MPLMTYEQTRPWAKTIIDLVKSGKMPPSYSEKCCAQFSPEHVLKPEEIAILEAWANGGAMEGKKKDAPRPIRFSDDWKIDGPSLVISLPRSFEVPANAKVDDQYVILHIDLAEDKWASAIEIHPSDRSVVDHAILYVRQKNSTWLRNVPLLTMYAPGPTTPDAGVSILAVYSNGSPAVIWPEGMAKKLPAGSDLVLRIHYASKKTAAIDRTAIGINFLKERPARRVFTLQTASTTPALTSDALLLSFSPRLSRQSTGFEYGLTRPDGKTETLLTVKPYDAQWQQTYPLKAPRLLPKGTRLQWTAFGSDEPVTAYFDIAVDASLNP